MELRLLSESDMHEALVAHEELAAEHFDFLHGYEVGVDWTTFLRGVEETRQGRNLPDGHVPATFLLAHIEQVSVHPAHAGQGIGRRLIETVALWAKQQGCSALTLTTFADVPWNAPYYARLGFDLIPPDCLTSGLRKIRKHEAAVGLDAWRRVAMRRPLRGQPEDRTVLP